ncbi:MAG: hypothetical protein KDC84_14455, partial [Crocinitomicaceae bacterium]|nr:hypothetical protein [Crocinitomicaceae bacterium]
MRWEKVLSKIIKNPSILVLIFIGYFYLDNITKKEDYWKSKETTQWLWDSSCYYSYLPALFIYDDLTFQYTDSINNKYANYNAVYLTNESGDRYQKTSAGVAFMEIPFFSIAHVIALNDEDYDPDG